MQEATGTVLSLVLDPAEPAQQPDEHGNVILQFVPLGVWMHMDACVTAPLATELLKRIPRIHDQAGVPKEKEGHHFTEHIIFVPCVQRSFKKLLAGKSWSIRMRQLPFSSAKDRTIPSSQGMTLDDAATVVDMGIFNTQRDDYWLNLYVALSRATRLSDLFIFRSPPKSFFDQGPPAYLRDALAELEAPGGAFERATARADQILAGYMWPESQ